MEEPIRPAWMKEGWRPINGVITQMDIMRFRALHAYEEERRVNRIHGRSNRHMMPKAEFIRHLVESTSSHRFTEPIVLPKKNKHKKKNKKKKDVAADEDDVSDADAAEKTTKNKRKRESDDDVNNNKKKKHKKNVEEEGENKMRKRSKNKNKNKKKRDAAAAQSS